MSGQDGRALGRKFNPFPPLRQYGGICIPPSPHSLSLLKVVALHHFKFPLILLGCYLFLITLTALYIFAHICSHNQGFAVIIYLKLKDNNIQDGCWQTGRESFKGQSQQTDSHRIGCMLSFCLKEYNPWKCALIYNNNFYTL